MTPIQWAFLAFWWLCSLGIAYNMGRIMGARYIVRKVTERDRQA